MHHMIVERLQAAIGRTDGLGATLSPSEYADLQAC